MRLAWTADASAGAARRKHRVQLTDCLLASVSALHGCRVWSTEADLARLAAADPRVRLYSA